MSVVGEVKKMKIEFPRATVLLQTLKYYFAELTTRTVFKNDLGFSWDFTMIFCNWSLAVRWIQCIT